MKHAINRSVRLLRQLALAPTRWRLRRRLKKPVVEAVCGHGIVVLPEVFNPVVFRTGEYFARFLRAELAIDDQPPLEILDLGTGSGVLAVVCASLGHAVVATDLNPKAVECARINARPFGSQIDVRQGDLFEPVTGERFDVIVWNPPFFEGQPTSLFDLSWRSSGAIDRFASEATDYLRPDGRIFFVWSSQSPESTLVQRLAKGNLRTRRLRSTDLGVETVSIYEIVAGIGRSDVSES